MMLTMMLGQEGAALGGSDPDAAAAPRTRAVDA